MDKLNILKKKKRIKDMQIEKKMGPKYRCLNCGRIWRDKEIMIICPICRSKPIKIKDGIDIGEVVKKIKGKVIR